MAKHPMQPVERDPEGTIRFKQNAIVRFLLNWSRDRGMGLNEIGAMNFSGEDRMQLAQLIGYSVGGYAELPYVTDESYAEALEKSDALQKESA